MIDDWNFEIGMNFKFQEVSKEIDLKNTTIENYNNKNNQRF